MQDLWLQQWLPLIRSRVGALPILELGCGEGEDTLTLGEDGHHVIAIDLCALAIAAAKITVPTAEYYR
jgi:2-polyprenyl-3-methyl-5-hydroxy-6-metoxy-1,4-benzoquinol methylase